MKNLWSHATAQRTQREETLAERIMTRHGFLSQRFKYLMVCVASSRALRENGLSGFPGLTSSMTTLLRKLLHGVSLMVVLALFVSPAHGYDTPQLSDFARMMPVTLAGTGPLHELSLPAEVYAGVTRADLGDLALFDGAGEIVPFTLVQPPPGKTVVDEQPLPLFPLAGGNRRQSGSLALQVRTDEQGASVTLNTASGVATPEHVPGYIIDARDLKRPVSGFDLDFNPAGSEFLGTVRVETSDDLRQWREHAAGALAALTAGDRELHRSRIDFPAVTASYFRLGICPGSGAPRITAVTARLATPATTKRDRRSYPLAPVKGKAGDYLVRTDGNMPVDHLRLVFTTDNSLAGVTFLSRPDDKSPWNVRGGGTCYRLRRETTVLESAPLEIVPTTDREWLIRVRQPGSVLSGAPLLLEIGWQPARLIFAARGEPPFRLAYGSARIDSGSFRDDSMAGVLATLEQQQISPLPATAGASVESGGRKALRQQIPATTWRKLLLWCALSVGVLLLARMAWRLAREMGLDESHKNPPRNGRTVVEEGERKGNENISEP